MMVSNPKFIVIQYPDGYELRAGRVDMHRDLKPSDLNDRGGKILGGGWWLAKVNEHKLYLYSKSIDFGPCTREQVIAALGTDSMYPVSYDSFDVYFSHEDRLDVVLLTSELIKPSVG